jgi:hypothetical protein
MGLAQHIKEHSEGLYAVIFSLGDVEQARDRSEDIGIRVLRKVDIDRAEIKRSFQNRFNTFIEYFLNPEDTHGVSVVLGQF